MLGESYKRATLDEDYDAVIVGSGMGGLTAAALLGDHGQRVLVLERHYTAGGYTHVFRRPGYEWDVGVHYIGQMYPRSLLRRAFDMLTGGELEWADMGEVYDTIVIDGDRYPLRAGKKNFKEGLLEHFPKAESVLDRYLELVKEASKAALPFYGEKIMPAPVSMVAGGLLRRSMLKYARRTVDEVLSELTEDRRLRAVLCGQFGDYGLPPKQASFSMHAAVVNHYLGGGAYPVGGSSRIAATILPRIEAAGGRVLTSAEVSEILVRRGRVAGVKMADGREIPCPVVISDAGASNTFERLLPRSVQPRKVTGALEAVRPSVAHASLYLGFRGSTESLGLGRSNVWRYPHDDFDRAFGDYLADEDAPLALAYLSFPSAKDPSFEARYPGKSTVEVVTLAPHSRFAAWSDTRWKKRGDHYEEKKAALTERLLEALYAEHPQLEAHLDHAELSTPLTTQHFAGFADGEIYGLEHTPARFEQTWLKPKTPIAGLYLTGSDVCTAGVGGALMGGVLTASALTGKNLMAALAKQPAKPVNSALNPRWAQK